MQQYWETQKHLLESTPIVWDLQSLSLFEAIELLAARADSEIIARQNSSMSDPRSMAGPAMLMAGLAIETALKGLAVERLGGFQQKLETHALEKLAAEAQLSLTGDESLLMQKLEQYITWAGRYPTPKKAADMMPRQLTPTSAAPINTLLFGGPFGGDFGAIRLLYQRIRSCQSQKVPLP